jgi:hypothetical protein
LIATCSSVERVLVVVASPPGVGDEVAMGAVAGNALEGDAGGELGSHAGRTNTADTKKSQTR